MRTKRPLRREERARARVAIITQHPGCYTLTMRGFEEEDLEAVKDAVDMTYDREDRSWILGRRQAFKAIEVLEDLDFVIRHKRARDEWEDD